MLGKINKNYLLKVKKLSKVFEIRDAALRKRTIKAVDSVSFGINKKHLQLLESQVQVNQRLVEYY